LHKIKILGIDPGLVNTGWAILEVAGNNVKYVASGAIKTSSKEELGVRLGKIYDGVNEVISTYNPSRMSLEETYVNKNPQTSLLLGHARGVSILLANQNNLHLQTFAPREVKNIFSGHGAADKLQMQKMLKILLPTATFSSHDEADAIAIAYTGAVSKCF
jgi:crossover junction endodeoxyribonuclease RuvC